MLLEGQNDKCLGYLDDIMLMHYHRCMRLNYSEIIYGEPNLCFENK
jgi:hypothetical protein